MYFVKLRAIKTVRYEMFATNLRRPDLVVPRPFVDQLLSVVSYQVMKM